MENCGAFCRSCAAIAASCLAHGSTCSRSVSAPAETQSAITMMKAKTNFPTFLPPRFTSVHASARHHPDLVLMDYRMPKLNGATACRNILSKDPAARVILVTAWSPSDEVSQSGALSVLPKPVSLQHLEAALNRVAETVTPDA